MNLPDAMPFETESFLEYAFVRWVLLPSVHEEMHACIEAQKELVCDERVYRLDFEFTGIDHIYVVELDGFEFHGTRHAFTYDRLRQNDIHSTGRIVIRFTYDAIRHKTSLCVRQFQDLLANDEKLRGLLVESPIVEIPEMDPDPLYALAKTNKTKKQAMPDRFNFDLARQKLNRGTLRMCQRESLHELANYFWKGGRNAACVMSVGAGKTALGVAACLAFTKERALIVTPGSVIRGTFDNALNANSSKNVLYALPRGPMLPGCPPPKCRTLDRDDGGIIKDVTREDLLGADIIVTNFHTLGTGDDPGHLLSKLDRSDIDFIVIDEAHIAASDSYQRCFSHFSSAKRLLMSACFSRMDGKAIDADVIYRYRLIDSIADGHAKIPFVRRFEPDEEATIYELIWPDGSRQEIRGRDAMMELMSDEKKMARITARSTEPIERVMKIVRESLDELVALLNPVKPRVLFSALGERHADQITKIANAYGIPTDYLHHTMTESKISDVKKRFESESGDLQGVVQLKMLGQGYDLPAISIVVPMRPYASFGEFYQFIGRGIRKIHHPAFEGREAVDRQLMYVVYHADLGLDDHIETIYRENDMDPAEVQTVPVSWTQYKPDSSDKGSSGHETSGRPTAFVIFSPGAIEDRVVHDEQRMKARKEERELEALAQQYAIYAEDEDVPVTFEQFVRIKRLS